MVSPNLVKNSQKSEKLEMNENTKKLFQVIYSEKTKKITEDEDLAKIRVSSLVSRLAFFYEKARNAVDYEEEHLLRKTAIARILKRQIVIEGVLRQAESLEIAKHLLIELIRGGYLANDSVPETKIEEIAFILEKYILLKNFLSAEMSTSFSLKTDINKTKDLIQEKNNLISWLLNLAACEIEDNLAPNKIKKAIVVNMFDFLTRKIQLPDDLFEFDNDKDIQIYLSIARTYLKFDEDILSFVLFKYYNSFWLELNNKGVLTDDDKEKIKKIAISFRVLKQEIDKALNHPLKKQLNRISRTYSLYFNVLSETIEKDPLALYGEIQKGEKGFVSSIKKACNQKYAKAKAKLWRAAIRSILYIFLTKSIFVLAIEIPAIRWFGEDLHYLSLAINIVFPAVLLFFIVLTTRKPAEDNTEKIINGIKEIAFISQDKKSSLLLRKPRKRNLIAATIFNLIYAASFCFSIYLIIKLLTLPLIGFTWVSVIIFLFFLAFVSFFSVLTTKGVKELLVVERRESLLSFLIDLFYLPIIMVGRWLSNNMSKVNIFVFIFDFIIEAPFKILVDIADDWTKYVREKRDNME
ncbi:hypothetical protein JXK06_03310 [Patescibacteria group bacterium]|nr:hypothetical protein [Patescibacteria group bacterium]